MTQSFLGGRLGARRAELEQTALARIRAISDPVAVADPSYIDGLHTALTAAVDYGLAAITSPTQTPEPVPVALLSQARLAARNGIDLDAVLRRYLAGHTLLADVLLDEAAAAGMAAADLKGALRSLGAHYERIVVSVTREYRREVEERAVNPEPGLARIVRRLLAGEFVDPSMLSYEFDAVHVGLVASGGDMTPQLRRLAARLDRSSLLVRIDERTIWAWLGSRGEVVAEELELFGETLPSSGFAIGIGEPSIGAVGWRLTHRQALAALMIAQRRGGGVVRYGEEALLAAALQDELLATSLRGLFLEPLNEGPDGGAAAKDTLRAYFARARNVSAAAAALGVNRRTVASRLATIEKRFGCRFFDTASAEIETALRLDELDALHP